LFGVAAEKQKEDEERRKKEAEEEQKRVEDERRAKEDLERWGRYWVWEEYFNPEHQPYWEDASNRLFSVNDHVQQDIEDVLLLQGFKGLKLEQIQTIIGEDKERREEYNKILNEVDPTVFKEEDERRNFLNSLMRPPLAWNFFEDDDTVKTPHVLRSDAQPNQCYIDGRIDVVMQDIAQCGDELKTFY